MRRVLAVVVCALTLVSVTDTAVAAGGSDSSGTHSYTSTCEAGFPHFTNTSNPTSTGDGVIEFRTAGATLTLSPGESGALDAGEVSPDTQWDVVFFDLGERYVFDGGTFGICEPPTPTEPLPYSVSVVEGCNDGEPIVNFTNTGTAAIYVNLGTSAQLVNPGATVAALWPTAEGGPSPEFEWHAYEFPDPIEEIGPEFATGTVFLANACGATTGPVEDPDESVIRNLGVSISPSLIPSITVPPATVAPATVAPVTVATVAPATVPPANVAPTPLARFEGAGTKALDLGAGLLADDELYLLDVAFTAASDLDTLRVDELDETFEDQIGGLFWSIGSFEGRFVLNAGDATTRYLQVETEGSWTFTIWPLLTNAEPWIGGEAHGVGPDVLLFSGEPGPVTFVHRGESNFAVALYGVDRSPEVSISELKNVDETVTIPVSPAVVVIGADGEWWLRR